LTRLKIFFATDIHGSETCFRKFINAGRAYEVDALIMGGDMTGKMIVPLVEGVRGTYSFQWLGAPYTVTENDLAEYEAQMRMSGCYPYRTTPEEAAHLEQDKEALEELFHNILQDSIHEWLSLAEDRLRGTGIECYMTPGNDDDFAIDPMFEQSDLVCNPENQVVRIKDEIEMISTGYSNPTPWDSPREMSEEALGAYIEGMASCLEEPSKAIFNFHCPPYNLGLDTAPRLDETLKPVAGIGGVQMIPVGSTAVLKAIKRHNPILGLHGHIHESRGSVRVGRTRCINPGSEYTEGILRGCLVLLEDKKVRDYLLTSG